MTPVPSLQIERRFVRSARLDADIGTIEAVEGFVVQPSVRTAFEAIARSIDERKGSAFTWTGPYGSGKSSAAIVLAAAAGPENDVNRAASAILGSDLSETISKAMRLSGKGRQTIALSGRRAAVVDDLAAALELDSSENLLAAIKARADAHDSDGLLMIVDELGKYLEHAALEGGDLHILQDIAEYAARSNGRFILIGILHQSFERYAARLPRTARDEWAKIQGRFQDVAMANAVDETLDLIARAIKCDTIPAKAKALASVAAHEIAQRRSSPLSDLAGTLERCWPLHPVVALLLGPLSRQRFGQNERSVFGFLGSAEPFGFQEFAACAATGSAYTPPMLFDYLVANLGPSILASATGHRFSTSLDAIDRATARGGNLHAALAKSASLIELFGSGTGLVANPEVLSHCVPEADEQAVTRALDELLDWSVLVHRRHLGSFAVFAGSDFDLEAAIAAERSNVERLDIAKRLALPPIVAKRHYHRTGCLRWSDVLIYPLPVVDGKAEGSVERRAAYAAAHLKAFEDWLGLRNGLAVIVLTVRPPEFGDRETDAAIKAISRSAEGGSVTIGVPRSSYLIRELATELHCLEKIVGSNPQLEGDAIARREVQARVAEVGNQLQQEIRRGFEVATWYSNGARTPEYDGMPLSAIASSEADRLFGAAPLVVNELINRDKPSSNAMAALRALLHAMVLNGNEERLGLQGFPPEYAFYASILLEGGLHRKLDDGTWAFCAPDQGIVGSSFGPLWQAAEALEDECSLRDLYGRWSMAPIGLRFGPMPILVLAWLLANQGSVAIYVDGLFASAIDDVVADRLLQSPEALTIRRVRMGLEEDALIEGLGRHIGLEAAKSATPLEVARSLVQRVVKLRKWVQRTRDLSTETRRVRDLLLNADDPNKLVFDELGRLAGDANGCVRAVEDAFVELGKAYGAMLEGLADTLAGAIGCEASSFAGLSRRTRNVVGVMGDLRLDAFAQRVGSLEDCTDRIVSLESLASFLVHRPSAEWSDQDVDRAHAELVRFARRLREAEAVAVARGRTAGAETVSVIRAGTGGEPVVYTVNINPEEAQLAKALADRILASLDEGDHRVALVALASIIERLELQIETEELAA